MRARTLEYESCPRANASANRGSLLRAFATRTCSLAAPGDIPTRHASHSAHDRNAGIELADEGEQARGGGIEVGRQLRDLVAQTLQLLDVRR